MSLHGGQVLMIEFGHAAIATVAAFACLLFAEAFGSAREATDWRKRDAVEWLMHTPLSKDPFADLASDLSPTREQKARRWDDLVQRGADSATAHNQVDREVATFRDLRRAVAERFDSAKAVKAGYSNYEVTLALDSIARDAFVQAPPQDGLLAAFGALVAMLISFGGIWGVVATLWYWLDGKRVPPKT